MNANELIEKVKEFEGTIARLTQPLEDTKAALDVNTEIFKKNLANLTEQVGELRKLLAGIESAEAKKFKRALGKTFWYVTHSYGKFIAMRAEDDDDFFSRKCFENNNYFLTKERTQEVAKCLNKIMCEERVCDEYPEVKVKINVDIDTSNYNIPIGVEISRRYFELLDKQNIKH